MPSFKRFTSFIFIAFIATTIFSCTTVTTRIKNPVLSEPADSLIMHLHALVSCQHFNLDGKDIITNGNKSSLLEIDITNAKGLPDDDDSLKALGKQIASTFKQALKDRNEYNDYQVLFIKESGHSIETTRSWRGKVYKSSAL